MSLGGGHSDAACGQLRFDSVCTQCILLYSLPNDGATLSCPICEKRKGARFCPAKGETICAVCCGTGREVTIDCTPDCPHLIAAHRYEDEHPHSLPADTPLLDVNLPSDVVHTQQQLMAAFAFTIAKFCTADRDATDSDVLPRVQALAETYKTLRSGIYYENPPDARLPRELYAALTGFIAELKRPQPERSNSSALKDADIFYLPALLNRKGLLPTNSSPRSPRPVDLALI